MIGGNQDIGFVIAAYCSVAAITLGLIVAVIADARRQDRRLSELEAKGIGRAGRGDGSQ